MITDAKQHLDVRPSVLVLGGTGKTGRRVVRRLTEKGIPTRVGSRSSEPPFEWQDSSTWEAAFDGITAVYVAYYPDLAATGASEAINALTAAAVGSGVRRLVLLSGRGEERAHTSEQIVRESGAEWAILRASWFAQNFSEFFLYDELMATGRLALPVGGVQEPFIDAEDIAEAAVVALTEDGHAGRTYEITGPRSMTFAEAVREIAKASDREFGFQPVSLDAYSAAMTEQGLPDDVHALMTYLFSEVLDGRNASTTDGIREILGREPRDFSEYARSAANTWR